jgi:hypothetical protein
VEFEDPESRPPRVDLAVLVKRNSGLWIFIRILSTERPVQAEAGFHLVVAIS